MAYDPDICDAQQAAVHAIRRAESDLKYAKKMYSHTEQVLEHLACDVLALKEAHAKVLRENKPALDAYRAYRIREDKDASL